MFGIYLLYEGIDINDRVYDEDEETHSGTEDGEERQTGCRCVTRQRTNKNSSRGNFYLTMTKMQMTDCLLKHILEEMGTNVCKGNGASSQNATWRSKTPQYNLYQ